MGKRKIAAMEKVEADLSYREDFQSQYHQYATFYQLFMQTPASADDNGIVSLRDLIDFVTHTAECYPSLTATFPDDLIKLLTLHHAVLESELREKVVSSLVLLRKKEIIDSSA
ncbi:Severe Depolymerization of Actin [Cryomyces antarcticus]|uniref:Protein SDA1 n=1 Tax=Cryomyces antarcticus TaxID=329879 RepID=A0ABR0LSU0_9PEZI|nr:Severe Depolymerization of Actin [Cryomyces antarcticus]KAK5202023.1 Severe Depolymerization of Actin [Cryomyces antarcticus]